MLGSRTSVEERRSFRLLGRRVEAMEAWGPLCSRRRAGAAGSLKKELGSVKRFLCGGPSSQSWSRSKSSSSGEGPLNLKWPRRIASAFQLGRCAGGFAAGTGAAERSTGASAMAGTAGGRRVNGRGRRCLLALLAMQRQGLGRNAHGDALQGGLARAWASEEVYAAVSPKGKVVEEKEKKQKKKEEKPRESKERCRIGRG